jgi:glycosyltransferase involved in cell wall biosynthesis
MKLLNICGYSWEIGGPSQVIFDHTKVQLRLGAEVTILAPQSPGERMYPVPTGARLLTVPRHPLARVLPEFSPDLYSYVRDHADEYDLIHLHGLFHFGSMYPLAVRTRARRVLTIHGTLDRWAVRKSRWKKSLVSALLQRHLLDRADLIHVHNGDEADDVHRYLGHAPRRLLVCNNGMDLEQYARLPQPGTFRERWQLSANEKIVLFLSRLNVKKGLDLLLPAFRELAARRPDVRLVIAGPDDGYQGAVEQFVAENNLGPRVLLTGMLTGDEKLAAFVDADVFALPTYSESFSIAALEAMLIGSPALLSDRVGFGEQLRATGAAHVAKLDPESVRRGLELLLDDAAYAADLRARGPRFVREFADINVVATRLYRAFEEVVAGR